MKSNPLVSVIIPTYNHADFLHDALQSLCDQSYENWEAIVVNNFSEDETISVVESFFDSRIRLENFRNNGVIGASRNHAISLANGELLAFLDSDDIWFSDKLERCIDLFDENVDLIGHGMQTFGDVKETEFFSGPESRTTYNSLLYQGNCLTPSATVVRKKNVIEVGGFSEATDKVTSEDYYLWIKLAQTSVKIKLIHEVLGRYRVHAMNQSGSILKHLDSILAVTDAFFPDISNRSYYDLARVRRRQSIAFYGAGREFQKAGSVVEAWPLFFKAILIWPFFFKTYIAMGLNVFILLRKTVD